VGAWLLVLGSALYVASTAHDYEAATTAAEAAAAAAAAAAGSSVASVAASASASSPAAFAAATAAVAAAAADDAEAAGLYSASAALWLAGSGWLVHASYPERVLNLAAKAAADAEAAAGASPTSRLAALPGWAKWFGDSSLLLGAWGLGLGAPTFLAGTAAALRAHPTGDPVPWLYLLAGVYVVSSYMY
jgi:hypothetical protein